MKPARLFCVVVLLVLSFSIGCTKPSTPASSKDNSAASSGNNPSVSPGPSASPSSSGAPGGDSAATNSTASSPAGNGAGQIQAQAAATPPPPLIIHAGRVITVRLSQPLGSKDSQEGQSFSGSVAETVEVDGQPVIERGATAHGTVVAAKAMGHFKGGALLELRLDSVTIKGERRAVETSLWSRELKGKGKRSAVAIGGGAGVGAALGGIFGGGKGAATAQSLAEVQVLREPLTPGTRRSNSRLSQLCSSNSSNRFRFNSANGGSRVHDHQGDRQAIVSKIPSGSEGSL